MMFPDLAGYGLLPGGEGMCSDDTGHTRMPAQSLITRLDCPQDRLARNLALMLIVLAHGFRRLLPPY